MKYGFTVLDVNYNLVTTLSTTLPSLLMGGGDSKKMSFENNKKTKELINAYYNTRF